MNHIFLDRLMALSARIGSDLNLVQAGGGNTSLKEEGTLWIKASGKWLIKAEQEDIFLPVPLADIAQNLRTQEERFQEYRTRAGELLRPSVETTMHAVLPQRVVIHVHSVEGIAWASMLGVGAALSERLAGLRWVWIPYTHPGIPLTRRIQEEAHRKPEVLILQNHGLVVAAEDCGAAENLLQEVERRLDLPARGAADPDLEALREVAEADWGVAQDAEIHALATDRRSCEVAQGGTLFPDQCVYLGPAAAVMREGERLSEAVSRYRARHEFEPVFLLAEGKGVLTRGDLKQSGRELLFCVKRVIERIPADAQVSYLEAEAVAKLMNWDAEKYRLKMA